MAKRVPKKRDYNKHCSVYYDFMEFVANSDHEAIKKKFIEHRDRKKVKDSQNPAKHDDVIENNNHSKENGTLNDQDNKESSTKSSNTSQINDEFKKIDVSSNQNKNVDKNSQKGSSNTLPTDSNDEGTITIPSIQDVLKTATNIVVSEDTEIAKSNKKIVVVDPIAQDTNNTAMKELNIINSVASKASSITEVTNNPLVTDLITKNFNMPDSTSPKIVNHNVTKNDAVVPIPALATAQAVVSITKLDIIPITQEVTKTEANIQKTMDSAPSATVNDSAKTTSAILVPETTKIVKEATKDDLITKNSNVLVQSADNQVVNDAVKIVISSPLVSTKTNSDAIKESVVTTSIASQAASDDKKLVTFSPAVRVVEQVAISTASKNSVSSVTAASAVSEVVSINTKKLDIMGLVTPQTTSNSTATIKNSNNVITKNSNLMSSSNYLGKMSDSHDLAKNSTSYVNQESKNIDDLSLLGLWMIF